MTAPTGRVRIVSDGTGLGTLVTVDGIPVSGVTAVEWRAPSAKEPTQAVLTLVDVEADVEAEVQA